MTDRPNFGKDGVCGDWLEALADLFRSSDAAKEGVVGVGGKLLPLVEDGDAALAAR